MPGVGAKGVVYLAAEGGVYYAFQGDEDQPDVRPKAQIVAGFKDFITKFYPANQQQTFIYRQATCTKQLATFRRLQARALVHVVMRWPK